MKKSAIVIGAGVIGLLTARALQERGIAVSVFDAQREDHFGSGSGASRIAAAMLAPVTEAIHAGEAVGRVGLRALALWRDILAQLPKAVAHGFNGSLVACRPGDEAELGEFYDRLRRSPLLADEALAVRLSLVDRQALHRLEPDLAQSCQRGLLIEPEAWLDGQTLLVALVSSLRQHGASFHFEQPVDAFAAGEVRTARGRARADLVFDARGIGALAHDRELRGIRGEICRLAASTVHFRRPVRVLHRRYPIYIVPRPHQEYLVGATMLETAARGPISVTSALELLTAAYSIAHGLRQAAVLELAADARPAYPDNLPRISLGQDVIAINGVYRHGFLLGPALAELAVALALDDEGRVQKWPEMQPWIFRTAHASGLSDVVPTGLELHPS